MAAGVLSHGRPRGAQLEGTARVDGRLCDVVETWLQPGFGRSARDRVTAFIDRADHVTRRVRFTLEGYVAETDTFDHERRFGVQWPRRLRGPAFTGAAASPAAAWA